MRAVRWAYLVLDLCAESAEERERTLSGLGSQGWELITLLEGHQTARFYFKRPEQMPDPSRAELK